MYVSDLYTPRNQNVHCAVSSNDQYQGNGFAADMLLGPKSRPNRSHRKRCCSISNIGNMMGCDHPSRDPVGPLAGELWHFEYFPNNDRPPFWILKISIFDHVTVIAVRICCCIPNFIKIGSRVRPPNAHNCWMSSAPLLGNGRYGNRNTADMSGTWWDATSQV